MNLISFDDKPAGVCVRVGRWLILFFLLLFFFKLAWRMSVCSQKNSFDPSVGVLMLINKLSSDQTEIQSSSIKFG